MSSGENATNKTNRHRYEKISFYLFDTSKIQQINIPSR